MYYVVQNGGEVFSCTHLDDQRPDEFIKSRNSGMKIIAECATEAEADEIADNYDEL